MLSGRSGRSPGGITHLRHARRPVRPGVIGECTGDRFCAPDAVALKQVIYVYQGHHDGSDARGIGIISDVLPPESTAIAISRILLKGRRPAAAFMKNIRQQDIPVFRIAGGSIRQLSRRCHRCNDCVML